MKKQTKRLKLRTDKYGNVITRTPEELALALGRPPEAAAYWRFRSGLIDKVMVAAELSQMTHAEIAEKVGTSRPRITKLLNHRGIGVSTDLLIKILGALGYAIEPIKVRRIAS